MPRRIASSAREYSRAPPVRWCPTPAEEFQRWPEAIPNARNRSAPQDLRFLPYETQASIAEQWLTFKISDAKYRRFATLTMVSPRYVVDDRFLFQSSPHHLPNEFGLGDIRRFLSGHPLSITKNRHPISQRENLVEPVTYINDCCTTGAKIANDREKPDVMLRQHRGRFVKMSTCAFKESALAISTRCRLPTEIASSCADIDIRCVQVSSNLPASLSARRQSKANPPSLRGMWPEKMFSVTVNSG